MTRAHRRVRTWLLASAALLVALSAALGGLIPTAQLEDVVRNSTHVAIGRWDREAEQVHVDAWLRGERAAAVVRVHGMPRFVAEQLDNLELGQFGGADAGEPKSRTERVYAFLEDVDGQLHLNGYRRYGGGFPAHSSVYIVTDKGAVLRFIQQMNPGSPAPMQVGKRADFRKQVEELIRKLPYEPPRAVRAPIAEALRESFFEALGEALDWYQGAAHEDVSGWGRGGFSVETIRATAQRLCAWTDEAPLRDRVHGLDAMMVLCRRVQGGGPDTSSVEASVRERLKDADPVLTRAWIKRELLHGDSYVNRAAFGRLAKELGPEAYAEALGILEDWVERTEFSEGTACYWALVYLGHKDRAEAAVKRREK